MTTGFGTTFLFSAVYAAIWLYLPNNPIFVPMAIWYVIAAILFAVLLDAFLKAGKYFYVGVGIAITLFVILGVLIVFGMIIGGIVDCGGC